MPTYDSAFQTKIITHALRDEQFMARTEGLIQPEYFDQEALSYLADLANRHYGTYKTVPSAPIVVKTIKDAKVAGHLKDEFVDELKGVLKHIYSPAADLSNRDFMVDEVAKFARERAMYSAIEFGVDVLDKGGDYNEVERRVREALTVGANDGTGHVSFTDDAKARIKARIDRLSGAAARRGITTGHRELDDLLYHKGWGRKELSVLQGAAKAGKSMALLHFALKAYEAGFNVLYITCENSAEVTADRMDAAAAGVPMRDLDVSGAAVEKAVMDLAAKGGRLDVHEFPMGTCKVSDIRRLIRKYQAKGVTFDLLVVDYADEMAPESRHSRMEERHALSSIYTDLRALCTQENLAGLTATQTNRQGAKATTSKGTDVAEDFGKVRKADVFITINATEEEKKVGQVRLYFDAMRNSDGGITVHCAIDRSRMRFITRILKVT